MKNEEFVTGGAKRCALYNRKFMSRQPRPRRSRALTWPLTDSVTPIGTFVCHLPWTCLGLCSEELLDEHGCVVRVLLGEEMAALHRLSLCMRRPLPPDAE